MTPSHVSAGAFALASGLALAVGGEAASGFGGGPFGSGPGMEPLAVGNLAVGNALAEPGGGFGIMTPALAGIFDAALDIALAIGSLKWRLQHLFPTHPCWLSLVLWLVSAGPSSTAIVFPPKIPHMALGHAVWMQPYMWWCWVVWGVASGLAVVVAVLLVVLLDWPWLVLLEL